jgi:hypothetical protein
MLKIEGLLFTAAAAAAVVTNIITFMEINYTGYNI